MAVYVSLIAVIGCSGRYGQKIINCFQRNGQQKIIKVNPIIPDMQIAAVFGIIPITVILVLKGMMDMTKPKLLMFSPSDKSDNRTMSLGKDKMRMRKLLEKEHEFGTTSVVLTWNGTLSKNLLLEVNPAGGLTFDQTIIDEFINEVETKRSATASVVTS